MQRRDFIKRMSLGAGVAALPAAAVAGATHSIEKTKVAFDAGREELNQRVKSVEERLDQMDANHKKTMKMVMLVAGISVGMDLSIFL